MNSFRPFGPCEFDWDWVLGIISTEIRIQRINSQCLTGDERYPCSSKSRSSG